MPVSDAATIRVVDATALTPGSDFGTRYRIEALLGQGGMCSSHSITPLFTARVSRSQPLPVNICATVCILWSLIVTQGPVLAI
jgi:hypothetical protein